MIGVEPLPPIHRPASPVASPLAEMLSRLWRHKQILALCVLLTTAAAGVYLYLTAPVYFVHARLLVREQGLPLERKTPPVDRNFLATQAEILRSPVVVADALQQLPHAIAPPETDPVRFTIKSLSASPIVGTDVLSVGFRSTSPEQAIAAVEAIVASYRRYVHSLEHDTQSETLRLLTENEKQLREELADLEQHYQQLRQESPVLGQGKDAASVERAVLLRLGEMLAEAKNRRIDLENQLQALVDARQAAQLPIAEVSAGAGERSGDRPGEFSGPVPAPDRGLTPPANNPGETPLALVAQKPVLPSDLIALEPIDANSAPRDVIELQLELKRAMVRAQELGQRYGPKHPELRAAHQQTAAWQQLLQEALEAAPAVLERELAAVRLTESRLAELYRQEFEETKTLDVHLLKEQQALDNIQRLSALHESTLAKLREWQLDEQSLAQGQAPVLVRLLEGPQLDPVPIWPRPLLLLGIAALLGAGLGIGLILLLDRRPQPAIVPVPISQR